MRTFITALVAGLIVLSCPESFGALVQEAYLKASNTGLSDTFSSAVAASGDTLVIGAPDEASDATGVNGDQANDRAQSSGAAYVFVRDGTNWTQQAYLKASTTIDNGNGYLFGSAVAISGDTIAVGAPRSREGGPLSFGAVYIFVRNGTTWTQQAYLTNYPSQIGDGFAQAVAMSGDTVVVGAFRDKSNATGVNGNPNNTSAFGAGAAYVFVRTGTNWSRQAYLKASNTGANDYFGFSVGVSGDTVVIGARDEDSNATGVNGIQSNNSASDAGAAYIFVRTGTTWRQQAYLKASNTEANDYFGCSVAVSANTVVVGAYLEDSNASGVNGNSSNSSALDSGAAYVFFRNGTNWTQQAYMKASNSGTDDYFGQSVAVSGDTVLVGADQESSNATGVNGDQNNDNAPRSGAAYTFTRTGTNWTQDAYLKASNSGGIIEQNPSGDLFGSQVALADETALVGAPFETSNAKGINGDQSNNSLPGAGASYVFASPPAVPEPPFVTGDQSGLSGTTHARAFDGNLATYFRSSYNDWQYLQVDFGSPGLFSGLRRHMTTDGVNASGARITQGEGAQYSMDGVTWTEMTAANSTGWQGFINYGARQHAWRNVPYGWSASLKLIKPVGARYVRFNWDGDNDALNDVEIAFTPPALVATKLFTAVADAQTVSGQPGVNFGSQTAFSVAASAGVESSRSYLRFDLSGIRPGSVIHSAQLDAFVEDVGGAGTRKARVSAATAPWIENTITWSSQPPASAPVAIQNLVINQWHSWNVTALVQGWISGAAPNHGLAIDPDLVPGESFSAAFSSRESPTNHPRLIVSFSAPPHPQNTAYLRLIQESDTQPVGYFNGGLPTTPSPILPRIWSTSFNRVTLFPRHIR